MFQPYSGVKTSILILDKSIAKQSDSIAFFKVENDGFGLGAQRRSIDKNDLPAAAAFLKDWCRSTSAASPQKSDSPYQSLIVPKEKIAENGEYNLSGERYREKITHSHVYPLVKLESVIETITPPNKIQKTEFGKSGKFLIIDQSQNNIAGWTDDESYLIHPNQPLIIFGDHTCAVKIIEEPFAQGADGIKILSTLEKLNPKYLYYTLRNRPLESSGYQRHFTKLKRYEIPLPPLEVQKEIVAEIEGYQKVIDGARAVIDNYRPHIPINPNWTMVPLGDASRVISGYSFSSKDFSDENNIKTIKIANVGVNEFIETMNGCLPDGFSAKYSEYLLNAGDLVVALTRSIISTGLKIAIVPDSYDQSLLNQRVASIRGKINVSETRFLFYLMCSDFVYKYVAEKARSLMQPNLSIVDLKQMKIPLPSQEIQQRIVAEIEAEQAIITANRDLIERFEKKIQTTLARVWGEETKS